MKRFLPHHFLKFLLYLAAIGIVGFVAAWWVVPWCLPLPQKLIQAPETSPIFLSSDGTPLQQLRTSEDRLQEAEIALNDLSPHVKDAILSAEDKNFYRHGGLDFFAVLRAARDNLKARRTVSGASTISQQLIKITRPPAAKRTLGTKLREALLARTLELQWSKDQILTAYLNRLDFGNQYFGMGAASLGYFGKPPSELTLSESTLLASLPQNPTRLNPLRSPDRLRKRHHRILALMLAQGKIDTEQHEIALAEPWHFRRHEVGFHAPHLVELVKPQLPPSKAFVIHTTLDFELQQAAARTVERQLRSLTDKRVSQAAVVILENATGKVRALIGSRDFWKSEQGQINGAWMAKSPGSALKPFTYLLALEKGNPPSRLIPDLPVTYTTPTGAYRPENYHRRHHGPVTLRQALGNSLNIPAVRLLDELGGESILQDFLQKLGITTLQQEASHYGLGLTLGNAPVRLLELTNAYATLARLGKQLPYHLLDELQENAQAARQVASPQACFMLADMLSDTSARAWTFGNQSLLNFDFPCAVKTGTSTDYRDNWALGYTPEFTVGVWVGNFDNSAMREVSGVTGAGPILHEIFLTLREKRALSWFQTPQGLERTLFDTRLGKKIPAATDPLHHRLDYALQTAEVPYANSSDYSEDGRLALLPSIYAKWHEQSDSPLVRYTAIRSASSAQKSTGPRIDFPQSNAIYYLDPDLPHQGRKMRLRVNPTSGVTWHSPTLRIEVEQAETYAWLEVGTHEIVAENTSGQSTVRFEVRSLIAPNAKF